MPEELQQAPPVEQTQETAPPEVETPVEGEQPKPPRAEKRIAKITYEREEARREAEYWKRVALEGKEPAKPEAKAEKPAGAPKPEQYQDAAEYFEAVADYKARQIIAERDAKDAETKVRQRQQDAQTSYQQKAEAARQKYPDFDDVVTDDVPASPTMIQSIMESDLGPEIAYYLGNNPEEAARISKLAPLAAARALGRIEDRLDVKDAPKPAVSNAPPPIKPVSRTAKSDKNPDEMSASEWLAWRNKQIAERKRRR